MHAGGQSVAVIRLPYGPSLLFSPIGKAPVIYSDLL